MAYRKLDITHDQIVDQYLSGVRLKQIRCDRSTVYNVLKRRGLTARRPMNRSWLEDARWLRARGQSYRAIAKVVGVSDVTVARALREAGA